MKTPLEEMFPDEPGLTREYKAIGHFAYARIRTAGDGREIYRMRADDRDIQIDSDADNYETLDDFIAANRMG